MTVEDINAIKFPLLNSDLAQFRCFINDKDLHFGVIKKENGIYSFLENGEEMVEVYSIYDGFYKLLKN